MPLLTELNRLIGCVYYKDTAPMELENGAGGSDDFGRHYFDGPSTPFPMSRNERNDPVQGFLELPECIGGC
jgi:hypothetical protein